MTPSLPAPESVRPPCRWRWRRFLPRGNGPGDSVGGDTSGAAGRATGRSGAPRAVSPPSRGSEPRLEARGLEGRPGSGARAAHRQALRAEAPARPQAKASPVLTLRLPSLCGRDFSFLFFFLLFICYNYRFTGSCKNGTERFPTPFIRFPLEVVPHITSGRCHGREPTRGQRLCAVPRRFITHSFV